MDAAVFTPPPRAPEIVELKQQGYAGEPVRTVSHGWSYDLTGNTLLAPPKLKAIIDAAADPNKAVTDLSDAYRKEGYFLVVVAAKLRPVPTGAQARGGEAAKATAPKGEVRVTIIEGRITQKKVPPDIEPYFSGLEGQPDVTMNQVTRHAVLADQFAARNGDKLSTGFSPGEQPGGSQLDVNASPIPGYKPYAVTLQMGNYGSRYFSDYVAGINLAGQPGHGLQLTANYLRGLPAWSPDAQGSHYYNASAGASIVTPFGTYAVAGQKIHYRLGQISYPLNNTGDVQTLTLSGSQLLYASPRSRLGLTEAFNRVNNNVTVFEGAYTLTDQQYNYLSVGVDYTHGYSVKGLGGALAAQYRLNKGISPRTGTFATYNFSAAPTPNFTYQNLKLTVQQQLPKGFLGQFTLAGQWTNDTLPQQQEWVLGGMGSLSAYRSGVAVGDKGYALRLMVQAPSQSLGPVTLTLNAFFEAGGTKYAQIPGPWQNVTDGGLGLNLSTHFGTTASLVYGIPISRDNVPRKTAQDLSAPLIYFVLQQSF